MRGWRLENRIIKETIFSKIFICLCHLRFQICMVQITALFHYILIKMNSPIMQHSFYLVGLHWDFFYSGIYVFHSLWPMSEHLIFLVTPYKEIEGIMQVSSSHHHAVRSSDLGRSLAQLPIVLQCELWVHFVEAKSPLSSSKK